MSWRHIKNKIITALGGQVVPRQGLHIQAHCETSRHARIFLDGEDVTASMRVTEIEVQNIKAGQPFVITLVCKASVNLGSPYLIEGVGSGPTSAGARKATALSPVHAQGEAASAEPASRAPAQQVTRK